MLIKVDIEWQRQRNSIRRLSFVAAFGVLLVALRMEPVVSAEVMFVETRQTAFSDFTAGGTGDSDVDGAVDSAAASGVILSTPDTPIARTAARSSFTDISANAFFDDQFSFSFAGNLGFSTATFQGDVINISSERHEIFLEFFMPPSYLEYSGNAEAPFVGITGNLFVDLKVGGVPVFDFDAITVGNYDTPLGDVIRTLRAESPEPGVDVSGLLAPTISEVFTGGGFIRTVTVEFPALVGVVSLGEADPFDVLTFEYKMRATVAGYSAGTTGIVAINDPPILRDFFSLSSVPVAVPEPSTFILTALALVGLLAQRHRRRRA